MFIWGFVRYRVFVLVDLKTLFGMSEYVKTIFNDREKMLAGYFCVF